MPKAQTSIPNPNRGEIARVFESLEAEPLGTKVGEGMFGRVVSGSKEYVKVRVRNLSATQSRKYLKEAISFLRGGERTAGENAAAGKHMELTELREAAKRGLDPSVYEEGIKPVDAMLTFDNDRYVIPSHDEKGNPAPWTDVPEGCYDLYVGNYSRLNSADPRERSQELARASSRRRDVCIRDAKGRNENPFGFLEFEREVIRPTAIAIDDDQIYAENLVEV